MSRACVVLFLLMGFNAVAAQAMWTGRSRFVTTLSGKAGVSCEYEANGQRFWKTFVGALCPAFIEVE